MDRWKKALEYCMLEILAGRDIEEVKKEAAAKFKVRMPKNSEILALAPENAELRKKLFRKPTRTLSGVTPVAVMIKPEGSCKWNCIYCPAGKGPKSYTGEEPATLRARSKSFDPTQQVKERLFQYKIQGHPTDKVDVIIMGGTFLAMPTDYKKWFVKSIYDALNAVTSSDLEEAKRINETARYRVVGLTIETRPDVYDVDELLEYGTTKVELGVQHPDDKIYMLIKRGHTVKDVIEATQRLKDAGFKICYHIMPGLPGSNKEKDISMIKRLFREEHFRPDMLKIYPTLVMSNTELYEMYKRGEYVPYSDEEATDVISEFYRYIPKYVRVMRIQRDIPAGLIVAGVKKSNLRQLVEQLALKKGIKIREIRFREAGRSKMAGTPELKELKYRASGGREVFLSFEDENETLYGFLRLRFPYKPEREELLEAAVVRELHVYGPEAPVGSVGVVQHRGLGKLLLKKAEELAVTEGFGKIAVISAVGVRKYYHRLGYKLEGAYMVKYLN